MAETVNEHSPTRPMNRQDKRHHHVRTQQADGSVEVPQALQAFFESDGFEDAIRNAISIGGDSDTIACITGGVAEAFYGEVPDAIAREVFARLDEKLTGVTLRFLRAVGQLKCHE